MQQPGEYSREKSFIRSSAPIRVGVDFRIRFSIELYEFLNDIDVFQRINIQRLRWFGHAVRRGGWGSAKVVEKNDLASIGVINWRKRREGCVAAGRNPLIGFLWSIK